MRFGLIGIVFLIVSTSASRHLQANTHAPTPERAKVIEVSREKLKKKYPALAGVVDKICNRIYLAEFLPEALEGINSPIVMIGPPAIGKTQMVRELVNDLGLGGRFVEETLAEGTQVISASSLKRLIQTGANEKRGVQGIIVYDELYNLETPLGTIAKEKRHLPIHNRQNVTGTTHEELQSALLKSVEDEGSRSRLAESILTNNYYRRPVSGTEDFLAALWSVAGSGELKISPSGNSAPRDQELSSAARTFIDARETINNIQNDKALSADQKAERIRKYFDTVPDSRSQATNRAYLANAYGFFEKQYPGLFDSYASTGDKVLERHLSNLEFFLLDLATNPNAFSEFEDRLRKYRVDGTTNFKRGIIIFASNDPVLMKKVTDSVHNIHDPDEVRQAYEGLVKRSKGEIFKDFIYGIFGEPSNPEAFLSRWGDVEYILPASSEEWLKITGNIVNSRLDQLRHATKPGSSITLEAEPSLIKYIYELGVDPLKGARPLIDTTAETIGPAMPQMVRMLNDLPEGERRQFKVGIIEGQLAVINDTNKHVEMKLPLSTTRLTRAAQLSNQGEDAVLNAQQTIRRKSIHEAGKGILGTLAYGSVPERLELTGSTTKLWKLPDHNEFHILRNSILADLGGIAAELEFSPSTELSSQAAAARNQAISQIEKIRALIERQAKLSGKSVSEQWSVVTKGKGRGGFLFDLLANATIPSENIYKVALDKAQEILARHRQLAAELVKELEANREVPAATIKRLFQAHGPFGSSKSMREAYAAIQSNRPSIVRHSVATQMDLLLRPGFLQGFGIPPKLSGYLRLLCRSVDPRRHLRFRGERAPLDVPLPKDF